MQPQRFLASYSSTRVGSTCVTCAWDIQVPDVSTSRRSSTVLPRALRVSMSWNSTHASLRSRGVTSRLRARRYFDYLLVELTTVCVLAAVILSIKTFRNYGITFSLTPSLWGLSSSRPLIYWIINARAIVINRSARKYVDRQSLYALDIKTA